MLCDTAARVSMPMLNLALLNRALPLHACALIDLASPLLHVDSRRSAGPRLAFAARDIARLLFTFACLCPVPHSRARLFLAFAAHRTTVLCSSTAPLYCAGLILCGADRRLAKPLRCGSVLHQALPLRHATLPGSTMLLLCFAWPSPTLPCLSSAAPSLTSPLQLNTMMRHSQPLLFFAGPCYSFARRCRTERYPATATPDDSPLHFAFAVRIRGSHHFAFAVPHDA